MMCVDVVVVWCGVVLCCVGVECMSVNVCDHVCVLFCSCVCLCPVGCVFVCMFVCVVIQLCVCVRDRYCVCCVIVCVVA